MWGMAIKKAAVEADGTRGPPDWVPNRAAEIEGDCCGGQLQAGRGVVVGGGGPVQREWWIRARTAGQERGAARTPGERGRGAEFARAKVKSRRGPSASAVACNGCGERARASHEPWTAAEGEP